MGALRGGFVIVTFVQRVVDVFHYTPLLPLLLLLPQVFLWDLAVRCFTQCTHWPNIALGRSCTPFHAAVF